MANRCGGIRLLLVALPLCSLACIDDQPAGVQPAALWTPYSAVDVILQEEDSAYVAQPLDIMVGDDGSFFVADGFSGRILRFSRDGNLVRTYGRKGLGPGELSRPSPIFLWNGMLAAGDRGGFITLFDLDDGSLGGRSSHQLLGSPSSPTSLPSGEVWLGVHSYSTRTALAVLRGPRDEPSYVFALPQENVESARLQVLNLTAVAPFGDSLMIAGLPGFDKAWLLDRSGAVRDSFAIPGGARKGVPQDIVPAVEALATDVELFDSFSFLTSLVRLSNGAVAFLHYDYTVIDYQSFLLSADLFVTVVAPDLVTNCGERLILSSTDRPRERWQGDTLFVFTQEVAGDQALARIQGFHIDARECRSTMPQKHPSP